MPRPGKPRCGITLGALNLVERCKTVPLKRAAEIAGVSTRTLRRGRDAGRLEIIKINRRVHRVALQELSLFVLEKWGSLSTTTHKRVVGSPLRSVQ